MLNGVKVGFAVTGAFQMIKPTIKQMGKIVELGAQIIPIMSLNSCNIDTRYGKAKEFISQIEEISQQHIINTLVEAERINKLVDIMVIIPCTGNTLSKLANGIANTPVLLSAKSNLRNGNSLVLGISTNDGLSTNAVNIGKLLNTKDIYFVPFRQDNPITKPNSLVFDYTYIIKTIEFALNKEQIQPLLL